MVTNFADGTNESHNVTVNVTQPTATTNLPQLVSASIVKTTTPTNANASNPAGTTVQYVFSRPMTGTSLQVDCFHVLNYQDNNRHGHVQPSTRRTPTLCDALFRTLANCGGCASRPARRRAT